MESSRERLIRYLNDCWAAEKALVNTLKDMGAEANDPEVRSLFEQHAQMTWQQEEALEARIRALGEEPSGGKGIMNNLMGKVADLVNAAHDDYDKTTQNLCKAFATENLEIAMYESLSAYAEAMGDTETAQLARQLQQQERQTAERIWPHISRTAPFALRATEVGGSATQAA